MALDPTKKNLENTQFGRVCGDGPLTGGNGNRHSGSSAVDSGLEPLLDSNGRIIVRIAGPGGFDQTYDTSSGSGYTNEFIITNQQDRDIHINGYSDLPVPAYIQVLQVNFVTPGNLPFIVLPVAAGPGAFFKEIFLANGQNKPYWIAISSTRFIYTPIATPCLYVWRTSEVTP